MEFENKGVNLENKDILMIQFRVRIKKNFAASKILKRFYASGFIVCNTENSSLDPLR